MGTQVALHHRTQYRYDKAVSLGPQVVQLRPTPHCRTPILNYSLTVHPSGHILRWQLDPHANYLARLIFPEKTTEFCVDVDLVADLTPVNPFDFFLEPGYENFPFRYSAELARDLEPFSRVTTTSPEVSAFLRLLPSTPQSTVSFLVDLNQRVRQAVRYTVRLEHGVQSAEETLSLGSGSCRDSSWLLVQLCRQLGFAARFVSGYLIQLASTGGPLQDSADLHAWAEVFLPGAGWIGMDPTSGLFTAEGHIPLVCTPTAAQAAPIGGTVEPAGTTFDFVMSVRRLEEAPGTVVETEEPQTVPETAQESRTLAQPFSDPEWSAIREVAHAVDRRLVEQDVRLTMGGEPTFVGIDEPESPQWHVEALGAIKRTRGLELIRRLRARTAPGGLLHFGQGKWYPGEALPRWAFHCVSRLDGTPVWENPAWFAREDEEHGFGPKEALEFLDALCHRLGVTPDNVLAGYNTLGDDMDDDASEPAGYVLPLRRRQADGNLFWSSQLWFDRPDRLLLSGGTSPIGYRIPVAAMPWVAPDELQHEHDAEPFSDRIKLPARPLRQPQLFTTDPVPDPLPPLSDTAETATELIRPSLCVEARDGRLHVFLPYVSVAADYLDLVAAIEDTCQYLGRAIWIEGYTAPNDPRLRAFSLTPDPGVLEVNLPPTSDWDELETLNALLFEEALATRLLAAKFAYDGTHLATGGGCHIALGGATVLDSPILRRPDLLRSMVGFWQNHPALSYLFSGMYVGPTSQYPRVDEARPDALYELEVSFSQLAESIGKPEILDGLFRNLLVDVTGNTHRAEFCIDKLYPPVGAGLRLGLLELRAFEMAPHFRMGLVEMLLVRALVCIFWKEPFDGRLLRWGTALHDRFMLPHFVERDLLEVLEHVRLAGIPVQDDWFEPHLEFRFPKIGSIQTVNGNDRVVLELRQALEPWNVLAEETTAGGTGRSVDSSLERMQVKLSGFADPSHYVVACNGRYVPMTPTDVPGEAIAGIRYRARKLSAALHPTIPVHTPLTFELIDTRTHQRMGRCTYYAGPPDGRMHADRPADADEARARRLERFVIDAPSFKPLRDPVRIPPVEKNPSFPMTLDLRWPAPGGQAAGNAKAGSDA
ncbi:transglutaminase family protein [Acidipila sp. EB88]|uniref:transglutaminase family protein n=1 Tax=Acidipila sp. EB88 TaxID=2305226 RepID=UPI000F5DBB0B|nr:transglutaminase family protein [Acidipila sp. EB88]RRA47424.1 IMP dehydrogenase [Acidipila sp. EB88]